ncbi:MAG: radical SAM protein [Bacteroidaceae bacterium]|nr:radical SAM protein [Bacteroidaceae bacterium]
MKSTKAPLIAISRHRLAIDGKGITTLVGFHGCPLNCEFCINKRSLAMSPICKISVSELLERLMADNIYYLATGGGVTFGGGEPLLFYEFIYDLVAIMPKEWNITMETSLNVPLDNLKKVAPYIHEFIIDIKDMDYTIYKKYTGKNNNNVLSNLKWLKDNGYSDKVIIRIPLIPNYNTKDNQIQSMAKLEEMGFNRFDKFHYIIR